MSTENKSLSTFLTEWGGQVKALIEPTDKSKEEFVVTSTAHYQTSVTEVYIVERYTDYPGSSGEFLANLDVLSGAYPPYELEYVDGNDNFYIISDTPSVISVYTNKDGDELVSKCYIKNKYGVRSRLLSLRYYGNY